MVGDLDPARKCFGMIQHKDSMDACQTYIFLGDIERPSMHFELERPLSFFLGVCTSDTLTFDRQRKLLYDAGYFGQILV